MSDRNGHIYDMLGREADFYLDLFTSLDNNAVLRMQNEAGEFIPISCTREFTDMMECTPDEFIAAETDEPLSTVIPEDRAAAAYLLEHGRAMDGANHVIVRKRTMKGNLIWVDLHYSIFENRGRQYAYCNYYNVTTLKENERKMLQNYEELNKELKAISNENLAVIRSNLSRGIVEEISGRDLYEGDVVGAKIADLLEVRLNSMPLEADRRRYLEQFSFDHCLAAYERGEDVPPLVALSRRQSGRICFVRYSAGMRKDPATGDLTIFGIETEYNSEKVNEVLHEKVLARQYDMISYILEGSYGVVIGDEANIARGSIFPKERNGSYDDYIRNQVLPAIPGDAEREEAARALSLDTVDARLSQEDSYAVSVTCGIDGELYYKQFTFYAVDLAMKYYILLKSDYTDLQREQMMYNERLKTALDEANQANVAKTAFLSSMSHEIRTPMNAIIGLNSLALKDETLRPETRGYLEKISGSSRHLLDLINDILNMSRIESGRLTLNREEFSFREMIRDISTMVASQCDDKGLRFECQVRGMTQDSFIGDDMKLKQVLINILSNAVKFTPAPGSITLVAQQTAAFDDQTTIRFSVKDTGIGMSKEFLPRIFDSFTQEDSSRQSKYGSTGLGMAIAKSLVTLMNGTITVDSEPGVGTEFTVVITLKNCSHDVTTERMINPADLHVLVVDDEEIAAEHARMVLDEAGIRADICLSGKDALRAMEVQHTKLNPYNLVLLDWKMPEMDGLETARLIRQKYSNETTIVILTAYNWDDIETEARATGVDSFLAKPLFAQNILEEFERIIRRNNINLFREKGRADLSGKHILLAEDIFINAEIMKELLAVREVAVDHAENGREAVGLFEKSEVGYYDAVLMDIRMPEMDGLTAATTIRGLNRRDAAEVPIIALTANAFEEDVQQSLQAGMNAHLTKPVEPEHLYRMLEELIYEAEQVNH